MAEQDTPTRNAPIPARGVVRVINRAVHAAMHLLPGPARRALGFWSWSDLLDGHNEYGVALANGLDREGPVERLWRRGIPAPEGVIPWPREFNSFHNSWNWDCNWFRVPSSELSAWAAVWENCDDRTGQYCLNRALAGMAQAGEAANVRTLIEHGANPSAPRPSASMDAPWMRQLMGANLPMENMLEVLREVCRVSPISWRTWVDEDPWARQRSAGDMEEWRASGLPMPTGEAALLHARAWVRDPPLDGADLKEALVAVRWWKHHGALPPTASTRLLLTFLETARPGDEESYQSGMRAWAAELLDQGLPPRPAVGPRWSHMTGVADDGAMPWSHWAARTIFPENLPNTFRDQLFGDHDAWTATNLEGKTALDLHMDLVEADEPDSRRLGQERLRAWLGGSQLDQMVEQPIQDTAPAPAPRF